MTTIAKIAPCLWFDGQAEEAAKFYTNVFPSSRIKHISHYPNEGQEVHHQKAGSMLAVEFELDGQPFTALNGGPQFKFNEAVSLMVMCDSQAEVDRFWERLGAGGDPSAQQCGWLKDKFGLCWQIVPKAVMELWNDEEPVKMARAFKAMMSMKKLDLAKLKHAYAG